MKLALFDIDLTLISTGGAGRRAMVRAFKELFLYDNGFDKISFAGRTDSGILREALTAVGQQWAEGKEEAFKARYFENLGEELQIDPQNQKVHPGIFAILDRLSDNSDVVPGLLTGNWRSGARLKLEHFGLWEYFKLGAFSDDSPYREKLPPVAAKRFFDLTGSAIVPGDMFIIGDTPKDIECTRPFGATSVAVATGFFSMEQLAEHEPDYLFEDLSDTATVLDLFH